MNTLFGDLSPAPAPSEPASRARGAEGVEVWKNSDYEAHQRGECPLPGAKGVAALSGFATGVEAATKSSSQQIRERLAGCERLMPIDPHYYGAQIGFLTVALTQKESGAFAPIPLGLALKFAPPTQEAQP